MEVRTKVTREGSTLSRAGRRGWVEIAGWAGVAGPVLFTLSFLAQEAFRRAEYSPIAEPVSALEAGPHGWVQQVNFFMLGAITMMHAAGLHRGLRASRAGLIGPALLFVTGTGAMVAGVFPLREDASGATYDPGGHIVGGLLFFLGSPAALILLSRRMRRDPRWRGLSGYTLVCGVLLIVSAVVMNVLAFPDDGPLHDWIGLLQRIAVVVVLFPCRIVLGARLVTVARSDGP